MLKRQRSRFMAVVGACAVSIAFAAPAQATSGGGGNSAGDSLVNVQIGKVTVLVPIGIAANLCDINANILAGQVRQGPTTCTATAESVASPGSGGGQGGGNSASDSLVNVQIGDLLVALPIGIAANLCDINANILAAQVRQGPTTCTAKSDAKVD